MRAAEKYVAAVQACIDGERFLEESKTAQRMGPHMLLQTLYLSGLLGSDGGSIGVKDRRYSPRQQMLFLMRPTVAFSVKMEGAGRQLLAGKGRSSDP